MSPFLPNINGKFRSIIELSMCSQPKKIISLGDLRVSIQGTNLNAECKSILANFQVALFCLSIYLTRLPISLQVVSLSSVYLEQKTDT